MKFLIILLISLIIVIIKGDFFLPNNVRYCNSPYCKTPETIELEHVNCNNPHELQCDIDEPDTPKAPYGGEIYEMSSDEKQIIVDLHNKYRNNIACGNVTNYPQATQMKKLTWDDQLAEAAELNVNECDYGHDCHNTETYPNSGQNIDLQYTPNADELKNPFAIAIRTIGQWYNEHKNTDESIIKNYETADLSAPKYRHFTQMVTDRNTKIGCSILTYKNNEHGLVWSHVYTLCNYDSTNIENWNVYDSGAVGSTCPDKTFDTKYKCLCSN